MDRYGSLNCPHCGKFNDLSTPIDSSDAKPEDGDVTLCIGCGRWSIYEKGGYRLPTMEEWGEIHKNIECKLAEKAWHRMRAQMLLN